MTWPSDTGLAPLTFPPLRAANMTDYRLRPHLETAEQTRDRLRRAAEAAEIGTFYCPLPPQRLYWNARCKSHFWLDPGTPDEEIDIDTFYRRIHPDDRSRVQRRKRKKSSKGTRPPSSRKSAR